MPKSYTAAILCTILLLAACAPAPTIQPGQPSPDVIFTQAAQTVAVQLTLETGQTAVAQLTALAQVTATQSPTDTPPFTEEPTATATFTATPEPPTITPVPATPEPPTITPVPATPTVTPLPCGWAQFLGDVTIPDGATLSPGVSFTKTWRFRNSGSCTWNSNYALVFSSGDRMDGPTAVNLPGNVPTGQTVDLSVNLMSPTRVGEYIGYWQLRTDAGILFGVGGSAREPFWVRIRVSEPARVVYDFAAEFCKAEWRSGVGSLPCPGDASNTETGFVNRYANPKIENGEMEDEPAIITHPNSGEAGLISGRFPAFQVNSGDRFRTVLGCLYESYQCNVMFQLNFREAGGAVQNFKTWTEVYDTSVTKVDLDLSPLAGKTVEFYLTVLSNGNSTDDWTFWLLPRIVR